MLFITHKYFSSISCDLGNGPDVRDLAVNDNHKNTASSLRSLHFGEMINHVKKKGLKVVINLMMEVKVK